MKISNNCFFLFLVFGFALSEEDTIDPCFLIPDSGSSNGGSGAKVETRFYFSKINNKCSTFPFMGSKGNMNNFLNEEQCLSKCGNKGHPEVKMYEKAQNSSTCYYNGDYYKIGNEIPKISKDKSCFQSCYCNGHGSTTEITCANVDCFFPRFNEEELCAPIYKDGQCCPDSYSCRKQGKPPKGFTCDYKGFQYALGERIEDGNEYPCLSCTCNKNFKGELTTEGGVCREINCGISIIYQKQILRGCKPKYYNYSNGRPSCCPIEWENCDNRL